MGTDEGVRRRETGRDQWCLHCASRWGILMPPSHSTTFTQLLFPRSEQHLHEQMGTREEPRGS